MIHPSPPGAKGDAPRGHAGRDAFALVLHTHLPYVLGHGTWPHGSEWVLEAAASCYLPLLAQIAALSARGIRPGWTIAVSPVLAEQLADPRFDRELRAYLGRKRDAAAEDARGFPPARAELALRWRDHFSALLDSYAGVHHGDLIRSLRQAEESGAIELMTCAATHGYLPLLATPGALAAQLRVAVETHRRHFGRTPRGIWLPECAYRPGLERALATAGLSHFVVDAHLFGNAVPLSPYSELDVADRLAAWKARDKAAPAGVAGAAAPTADVTAPARAPNLDGCAPADVGATAGAPGFARAFARHAEVARQVWSATEGYPGDAAYLDFHKKHHPGGHRYWRVTGPQVDMGRKEDYDPSAAATRVQVHAAHYASMIREQIDLHQGATHRAATICAPFDTELFGHWWHEGVDFLGALTLALGERDIPLATLEERAADHKARNTVQPTASLPEGSWGLGGDHRVWANDTVKWILDRAEAGERDAAELARREEEAQARESHQDEASRARRQHARSLLLLESSDWAFLITVGTAADYAERRAMCHAADRDRLSRIAREADRGPLPPADRDWLAACEARDRLFPDLDPRWWR